MARTARMWVAAAAVLLAGPAFGGPTIELLSDPDALADHFVFACDSASDPQACLMAQFDAATRIQSMNSMLAERAATDAGEAGIEACGARAGVPGQVDLVVLADCLAN